MPPLPITASSLSPIRSPMPSKSPLRRGMNNINNNHHFHTSISSISSSASLNPRRPRRKLFIYGLLLLFICTTSIWTFRHYADLFQSYARKGGAGGTGNELSGAFVVETKTQQHKPIDQDIDDRTFPLHPIVDVIQGIPHYYLLPEMAIPLRGVLIHLHSCQQSGLDFFHLPEDRIIAAEALRQGLVVFSPSASIHKTESQDVLERPDDDGEEDEDEETTNHGCFTQPDISLIGSIVDEWATKHRLLRLPRVGMASSSGASFLLFVYQELELKSMALYNTPQSFSPKDLDVITESATTETASQDTPPQQQQAAAIPTALVSMVSDTLLTKRMQDNYDVLVTKNIRSAFYPVSPHPFTPSLCQARLPEWGPDDTCTSLFDQLETNHPLLLDSISSSAGGDQDVKKHPRENTKAWHDMLESLHVLESNMNSKTTVPVNESPVLSLFNATSQHSNASSYYLTNATSMGQSWKWAALEQEVQTSIGFHAMTSEHHANVVKFLVRNAGLENAD